MRNAYDIFMKIKELIPNDIDYDHDFLQDLIGSSQYQPPESIWIWDEMGEFVTDLVGYPPQKDWEIWKWEIVSILMDKSIIDLKEEFIEYE